MHRNLTTLIGTIEYLAVGKKQIDLVHGPKGNRTYSQAAALQALDGNVGLVAASSMLAMYDGEEMDYFVCYINGVVVQGMFPHVTFSNGDVVTAVVEKINGDYNTFAIHCNEKNLLWLPLLIDSGVGATLIRAIKTMSYGLFFGTLIFAGFLWMSRRPNHPIYYSFLACIPALCSLLIVWDFLGARANATTFEKILKILNFRKTFWFDINKFSLLTIDSDPKGECVYRYNLAIAES